MVHPHRDPKMNLADAYGVSARPDNAGSRAEGFSRL
jgi:hypothetical protein